MYLMKMLPLRVFFLVIRLLLLDNRLESEASEHVFRALMTATELSWDFKGKAVSHLSSRESERHGGLQRLTV